MRTIFRSLFSSGAVLAAMLSWSAPATAVGGSAALPTVTLDHCSWNRPGVNPFMGDVVAAVDRYQDIPVDVRARLKARMAKREYDDLVSIKRDAIVGRGGYDYGNGISEMHFGTHQVCRSVTRAAWTPQMEERGLVYCEDGHCILVPTVCRNVSRISRRGVGNEVVGSLPPFMPPGAGYPEEGGAPAIAKPEPWTIGDFAAPGTGLTPRLGGPIGNDSFAGIASAPSGGAAAPALFGGVPAVASYGGGGGSGRVAAPVSSANATDTPVVAIAPTMTIPTLPSNGETTKASGTTPAPSTTGDPAASEPPPAAPTPASAASATPVLPTTPTVSEPTTTPTAVDPAPITPVPEPGTWAMLAAGLVALVPLQKRRRARG